MISNAIKYSFRSLLKNKLYSGINLLGLSIGIAGVILIYKIVSHELSYNKNFKNYERIVRVIRKGVNKESGISYHSGMPLPAMDVIKRTIPQFEATSKVKEVWPTISVPSESGGVPTKKFRTDEPSEIGLFVEPSFFDIFDWQWIEGDKKNALKDIHTIVLTENMAIKCFGSTENAIGKYVSMDNLQPYLRVDGVVANAKVTSDLPVHVFISYPTSRAHPDFYFFSDDWGSVSSNDQLFALLNDKDQINNANNALSKVGEKEYKEGNNQETLTHICQKLSDLHYNTEVGTSGTHVTGKTKIVLLGFIGGLILIMACFNFINMANAQSITRIKEVGIRKTLGVRYGELMFNFLTETGVLVLCSIIVGIIFAYFLLPSLRHISPLPQQISLFDSGLFVLLGTLLILVTLLAGLYPATVLSSFQPSKIFRADHSSGVGSGVWVRKLLVVTQFVIAIGLIISTIITMSQLSFIKNMDLGFNKDMVYSFGLDNDSIVRSKLPSFRSELESIKGVENTSFSSDLPSSNNTWSSNWKLRIGGEDEPFNISIKYCDFNFQNTFKIKLLEGKWFANSDTSREAVINKTALVKAGITDFQSVIGTEMQLGGRIKLKIVGVAEDYHSHSAHNPLEALLMTPYDKFYFLTNVKITSASAKNTLASIENTFNKYFPNIVFNGKFYDKEIQRFYEIDSQLSALCKGFAVLGILISCLGLFALASFAITRRVREIGIRKVLGASTPSLVNLITKEFIILISIAFCIAAPIAYYLMNRWLQDFVFRTDIKWWMFAFSLTMVMIVSFGTVAIQAIKAAWANPISSLKSE